jgi:hypothetical protein
VARVLDKTQDSQKIAKLVEDFRQALIIYQVCTTRSLGDMAELTLPGQLSQQRSIDNQVSQLTVGSLPFSLLSELTGSGSNPVIFQHVFDAARGNGMRTGHETLADVLTESTRGTGKDTIRPCPVGEVQGGAREYNW